MGTQSPSLFLEQCLDSSPSLGERGQNTALKGKAVFVVVRMRNAEICGALETMTMRHSTGLETEQRGRYDHISVEYDQSMRRAHERYRGAIVKLVGHEFGDR